VRDVVARRLMLLGLGLLAGAVLPRQASAQRPTRPDTVRRPPATDTLRRGVPARTDTARMRGDTLIIPAPPQRDTIVRRDSLRVDPVTKDSLTRDSVARLRVSAPRAPADTIQAPFARAEMPRLVDRIRPLRWDREALFASGAYTLSDLLEHAHGVTTLRAGWIAAPATAAYLGEVGRVRLFLDGVELDVLDPRNRGVHDLSEVHLGALEELTIEEGATELRVFMRSWRVDRLSPYTRVDVATGDQQTNLYRGFFGRRWGNGLGLQLSAQQYGTSPARDAQSSDALAAVGRFGWARGPWSVDARAQRVRRTRGVAVAEGSADTLPGLEASRTDSYARFAWGDPERGRWAQLIVAGQSYRIEADSGATRATGLIVPGADTTRQVDVDTTSSRPQYVLTGGWERGALRFSAVARARPFDGRTLLTPTVRGSWERRAARLTALYEGIGPDSLARAEAMGQLHPLPWLSLTAALGRALDSRDTADRTSSSQYARAEGAAYFRGLWWGAGLLQRGAATLRPPVMFGTDYPEREDGSATMTFASIRGRLFRDVYLDVQATRGADTAALYRPRYQSRSELFVRTRWLSRFPSGIFGLLAALEHHYRDAVHYPGPVVDSLPTTVRVAPFRLYGARLEIRIGSAVLSAQSRNLVLANYQQVPGLFLPRGQLTYGVRWEFWN